MKARVRALSFCVACAVMPSAVLAVLDNVSEHKVPEVIFGRPVQHSVTLLVLALLA